jgi:ABC-type Na+ efflux pump permease subunit
LLYQQRRIVAILFTPAPAKERAVRSTFVYSSRVTFLPILRRELNIAARLSRTYRHRSLVAGLITLAMTGATAWMPLSQSSGARIFQFTAAGAFLFCAWEGLRATADTIARERREGTLGLLLLTDMRAYDLIFGKLAAALVQSLGGVLAMLPAFAIPVLVGGVTGGECWRLMLTLLSTLLLTLSIGLAASTLMTGGLSALGLALLTLLGISLVPLVGPVLLGKTPQACVWLSGPLGMWIEAEESRYIFTARPFWSAWFTTFLLAAGFLITSTCLLIYRPQLDPVSTREPRWLRWFRAAPNYQLEWNTFTEADPTVWLAERTLPGPRALRVTVTIGSLLCFVIGLLGGTEAPYLLFGCAVGFALLIKLWLAAVAPQSLGDARRSGALELLLCTPVEPERLVRGQVQALINYFFVPALVIAVCFPIAAIIGTSMAQNHGALNATISFIWVGTIWMILFVLDLHALAYAGLWFGLTTSRADRAVAKTAFGVLLLPWLTVVVPLLGFLGILGWPIFWIYWSGARLRKRFREEAAAQFSAEPTDSGWLPWSRK